MHYGKGIHNYRNFFLAVTIVSSVLAVDCLPFFAEAGWLTDFQRGTSISPHEKARAARSEAVENANIAFERAKAAGAESAAPYEFYSAEEYLKLAKEELAAGDKIGVALFAAKSEEFSFVAIEKAEGGRK